MSLANKKGVDISYANGNIDLAKVKAAGYEFVMIRCGYGDDIAYQDDTYFAQNVEKAEKLGMPWGTYLFSYACSSSQARNEVAHVKRLLEAQAKKGYKPTMPVALDIEPTSYVKNNGGWNASNINNVTTIWLDEVAKLGYYPMVYTGYSELDGFMSKHVTDDFDCWFAQWHTSPSAYKYKRLGIWQYGGETNYIDGPTISGVGTIDKNKCYKDYPTIIKDGGYNGFKKSGSSSTSGGSSSSSATTSGITEAQLRQKVANVMLEWKKLSDVGKTSTAHSEILKIYNAQSPLPVGYAMKNSDAWCAATVSAAWLKVGIAKYITTECGCGRFRDNAMKLGIWVENDAYKPKVGDAIIYYWGDDGVGDCTYGADHIGIVTSVGSNTFTVTEGNMGDGIVGNRSVQVNGKFIRGFITPDYAAIAKKVGNTIKPDSGSSSGGSSSGGSSSSSVSAPIIYTQSVTSNKWLGVIKGGTDYSGILGQAMVALAAKVSTGTIEYRVHVKGGGWLGTITGFNANDYYNGYAGNGNPATRGSAIDAIKMYYRTPQSVVSKLGYYKVAYRVHLLGGGWLPYQYDTDTDKGQDGYAGIIGRTIDGIEAKLVKA